MWWCQTPSLEFGFFIKGCHAQGRCQSDLSLLLVLYPRARGSGSSAWQWDLGKPESHSTELGLYFGGASHPWRRMHHCILMSLLCGRGFRAQSDLFSFFFFPLGKGDRMERNCPSFSRRSCWRTMTPSRSPMSDRTQS